MFKRGAQRVWLLLAEQGAVKPGVQSNQVVHSGTILVPQLRAAWGGAVFRPFTSQSVGVLRPQTGAWTRQTERGVLFFRRLFSSNAPKKGFENFTPKGQKASKKPSTSTTENAKKAQQDPPKQDGQYSFEFNASTLLTFLVGGGYILYLLSSGLGSRNSGIAEISFQEFKNKLLAEGRVAKIEVANNTLAKVYTKSNVATVDGDMTQSSPLGMYQYYFTIGSVDAFEKKLDEAQRELGMASKDFVPVRFVQEVSILGGLLELVPTLILVGFTYWLITRQMRSMTGGFGGGGRTGSRGAGGGAGGWFNLVNANVKTLDKNKEKMTFKDVAGCDEAKQEIMEFVDFLRNPQKYKELGAKIPKGALLVGPPGTGKTLLAKATAGEAQVPFLSISGSDFMEMFVGVGPARVRDLFSQARSQSPSIIFIDEIDAIGRARGRSGGMGGHDERENTLNQLLVEMDGFATTSGVVVLAGTNRPDVLDKALLRPGRFDRTISVDPPDIKGREAIFKVHLRQLKLAHPVEHYSEKLAALTPGMSGADIANVCNEAALVAARHNHTVVDLAEFEQAIDRVIGGLEKKNKVINAEERRTVALHESGHAVVSWFLEHAEPLLKVSIVPRGSSTLGFAQYLPNENVLLTKEQLLDRVCAILGGRAAEQVMIGRISTGAQNDLERVTQMAYAQVAIYGMNEKVGLVSFPPRQEAFDKPYSDHTAQMIDEEVRHFIDTAYKRTLSMVEKYKEKIQAMADELLRKEVLNLDDVETVLGDRPFVHAELRNIDRLRREMNTATAAAAAAVDVSGDMEGAGSSHVAAGFEGESQQPPEMSSASASSSSEQEADESKDEDDKGDKGSGGGSGGGGGDNTGKSQKKKGTVIVAT